jgi:hypothetical protein
MGKRRLRIVLPKNVGLINKLHHTLLGICFNNFVSKGEDDFTQNKLIVLLIILFNLCEKIGYELLYEIKKILSLQYFKNNNKYFFKGRGGGGSKLLVII